MMARRVLLYPLDSEALKPLDLRDTPVYEKLDSINVSTRSQWYTDISP